MKKVAYIAIILANFSIFNNAVFANNKTAHTQQQFEEDDISRAKVFLKFFLKEASSVANDCLNNKKICFNFADIIVNKFDLKSMAQFVLGPYFRKLSESEVAQFEKLLTKHFIKAYATHERIKLFASVDMENDDFNFKTSLNEKKNRLTSQKNFKTEKNTVNVKIVLLKSKDGSFNIFDILIEDIGLLVSTRDFLSPRYQNNSSKEFLTAFQKSANE